MLLLLLLPPFFSYVAIKSAQKSETFPHFCGTTNYSYFSFSPPGSISSHPYDSPTPHHRNIWYEWCGNNANLRTRFRVATAVLVRAWRSGLLGVLWEASPVIPHSLTHSYSHPAYRWIEKATSTFHADAFHSLGPTIMGNHTDLTPFQCKDNCSTKDLEREWYNLTGWRRRTIDFVHLPQALIHAACWEWCNMTVNRNPQRTGDHTNHSLPDRECQWRWQVVHIS